MLAAASRHFAPLFPLQVDASFYAFQRNYLFVYYTIMLADWLQGTNMYTLYQGYGVDIGALFLTGFCSSAVFGTVVGSFVDSFGRRNGCVLFCVLEIVINTLEHYNNFPLLLLGRVMGGISTSLLFSAFESWMVSEHRKRGYAENLLAQTFSRAQVGNGLCAIAAGFIAQGAYEYLGDIGPFQIAIALTVVTLVFVVATWTENYGTGEDGGEGGVEGGEGAEGGEKVAEAATFASALRVIFADPRILLVGSMQSFFEGGMYVFVFMWVPTLMNAMPEGQSLPTGLVFSSLMACTSIGGTIFDMVVDTGSSASSSSSSSSSSASSSSSSSSSSRWSFTPEAFSGGVYYVAAFTMLLPIYFKTLPYLMFAFLLFEVCVGAFFPAMAVLRSKVLPSTGLSTIMNIFRVPLNIIVVSGTKATDLWTSDNVFLLCFACHAAALVCQFLMINAAAKQKKKQ